MANMNHPNNMQPGVFGLALPDGYSFTAQALDIESLASEINVPVGSPAISHRVVHQFVFEKLFGLTSLDLFTYTKSTQEALDSVMAADGSAFFLGDPENPSMEDTAIATGVFPPRSVDLAPPVPAGWALWSLGDLDA